jgi:predicted O-methyltransferase YrrM
LRWGFTSREDTNYTYNLTRDSIKYLAHTVSVVTGIEFSEALKYINEPQNDQLLIETIKTAVERSTFKKFADKEVRFGRRLGWYAFARAIKPKIIIETGVDKGLGSILLCAALLKNKEEGYEGKYYGTDINPDAGYLLTGNYKQTGEILYGDSINTLSEFTKKIDLFISDSDHSSDYEYREYQVIKDKITEMTIMLGDDSHCNSWLADFSFEMNRNFLFFKDFPSNHWYPGAGIGISFSRERM